MLRLRLTSLILTFMISGTAGSASEPFSDDPAYPSTQQHSTSESTQAWLERRLREVGKLKEGQHLALHEVWRIADFLKARINARRVLKTQ